MNTNHEISLLHLIIKTRDRFHSITEVNLSSVYIKNAFSSENDLMKSSFSQLFLIGNSNTIGQLTYLFSQYFNQITKHLLDKSILSKFNFI